VDSGTNVLLLGEAQYTPVTNAIRQNLCNSPSTAPPGVCSGDLFSGSCYQYTQTEINQFPPLTLVLDSTVNLAMPPSAYIVNNGTARWYCLGIMNTGRGGLTIIGDTTLMNYYVQFDKVNFQMGWAPVNASACAAASH